LLCFFFSSVYSLNSITDSITDLITNIFTHLTIMARILNETSLKHLETMPLSNMIKLIKFKSDVQSKSIWAKWLTKRVIFLKQNGKYLTTNEIKNSLKKDL